MFRNFGKGVLHDYRADRLSVTKSDGSDKFLEDVLRDITKAPDKKQDGQSYDQSATWSHAEIAKKEGFLSVTSMNQLVHNPRFTVIKLILAPCFTIFSRCLKQ